MFTRRFGHNRRRRQGLFVYYLLILAAGAQVVGGCALPNNYMGRSNIIDASGRQVGYGGGVDPYYQYPQSGSGQWEFIDPTHQQQAETDYGNYGTYPDRRDGQVLDQRNINPEAVNPKYNQGRIDPTYSAGREGQNYPPTDPTRYYDQNTSRAISNRNLQVEAERQVGGLGRTAEDYRGAIPLPEMQAVALQGMSAQANRGSKPMASIVGVTEIGAPAGTGIPAGGIDRSSGQATANLADHSGGRAQWEALQQEHNNAVTGNMNRQGDLPGLRAPIPTNIDPAGLTQPAVSIRTPTILPSESPITRRERWLAEHPEDINTALALYYHYLVDGDQKKALEFLPQDFGQADLTLEALGHLQGQISERALLKISALKVCDKVDGFGRYEEIPATELAGGRKRWVEIYCELENYTSTRNAEGMYGTAIHAEITLYDSSYRPLVQLAEDVPDKPTYSPRRDFFLVGTMEIPALSPGRYIITVKVEDKAANKISRREEIIFQVGQNVSDNGLSTGPIRS